MIYPNWHKFIGEDGQSDQWVDLTHVVAVVLYRGGSMHPCNGGSLIQLPFGVCVGVMTPPREVIELVENHRGKEKV